MPAIRLSDIAARAGCSKATVSLALRNDPRVSAKTRKEIRALARTMGYQPNPTLAQIASERWRRGENRVAETVAYVTFRKYATPAIPGSGPARGMHEEAERLGFRLDVFPWHDYESLERITTILSNRGIRGVILGATTLPVHEEEIEKFPYDRFSTVACELGFHRIPVMLITPDHFSAARDLIRYAHNAGFRRIGAVVEAKGFSLNDETIEAGFVYEQWRIEPDRPPLVIDLPLGPDTNGLIAPWIKEHKPDLVITGFAARADALRKKYPKIRFLSLRCQHRHPKVYGTILPGDETGRVAMATLADQLARHDFGRSPAPETINVPFRWQLPTRTQKSRTR